MFRICTVLVMLFVSQWIIAQEVCQGDTTPTHAQTIAIFQELADRFPNATLYGKGPTDSGRPLHLFVVSHPDMPGIQAKETTQHNQRVLLINNAIHPGEACGVNASVMLAKHLLENNAAEELLKNTVVCIIPMYNIGGALQRNSSTRANQNGPAEYGFRGNARNLDLNRDFIKMDSRNAKSFTQLFHEWDPHVYLETHTSNGADYQYTMTMLATQKDKLGGEVGVLMNESILPELYTSTAMRGWEMAPYVNAFGTTPEDGGIKGFLDSPRYSSGYAAQFQCMGLVSEAHMLKPFQDRVNATYAVMLAILDGMQKHGKDLAQAREADRNAMVWQEAFPLNWQMDSVASDTLDFKGFRSETPLSQITGQQRLRYDQAAPVEMRIPVFNHFQPVDGVYKPYYYVVPQAWKEVIERLFLNGVAFQRFKKDTVLSAEGYYIEDYQTVPRPYEGHYLHSNTNLRSKTVERRVFSGDYLVPLHTDKDRFIVEVLEPKSVDSYFNWNFFDEVLQQKEWFSTYVFEDEAAEMLESDPDLKAKFEEEKKNDPDFAESAWAQLYWLYKHSPHYELQHNAYPILRITEQMNLPVRPLR